MTQNQDDLNLNALAAAVIIRATVRALGDYKILEPFAPQVELVIDDEIRGATGSRFGESAAALYSYGELRLTVNRILLSQAKRP